MARTPKRPNPAKAGILEAICDRLVCGESINSICADPAMPSKTDFYIYMTKNEEFRTNIARAKEAQQDAIVDEIVEMADGATPVDFNVVKLRIWARQWVASKLKPKKYGDRVAIDADVRVTEIDLRKLNAKQLTALETIVSAATEPEPDKG